MDIETHIRKEYLLQPRRQGSSLVRVQSRRSLCGPHVEEGRQGIVWGPDQGNRQWCDKQDNTRHLKESRPAWTQSTRRLCHTPGMRQSCVCWSLVIRVGQLHSCMPRCRVSPAKKANLHGTFALNWPTLLVIYAMEDARTTIMCVLGGASRVGLSTPGCTLTRHP